MSLPGLTSYHVDSEISDSEGEVSPSHVSLSTSGIVSSGLGIPSGQPILKTPPMFVPPSVHSAPSISLVGYGDEEEGMDTNPDVTTNFVDEPLPPSLVSLISRHDSPIEHEVHSDRSLTPDVNNGEPLFFPLNDIELPSEHIETCSQALQEKIVTHLKKKHELGLSPYDIIVKGKSFRNPSIYEKLIQLCGIDELGTNYDKKVFDPKEWKKEEYYEKLAEAQKKADENKQKSRGKIEFKSGTKLPATIKPVESSLILGGGLLPIPVPSVQECSKKRKSKWDNPSNEQRSSRGASPTNTSAAVGAQALVNARLIDKNLMKLFKS